MTVVLDQSNILFDIIILRSLKSFERSQDPAKLLDEKFKMLPAEMCLHLCFAHSNKGSVQMSPLVLSEFQ